MTKMGKNWYFEVLNGKIWCKSGPKYCLCLLLNGPPKTEFRINISHCNSSGGSCMKRLTGRANKKRRKKLTFSVTFSRLVQLAHCALATLGIVAYRTISLGVKNSQFVCERKARWFTRFETTWTTDIENLSPCRSW